jgi:hypothetical protein
MKQPATVLFSTLTAAVLLLCGVSASWAQPASTGVGPVGGELRGIMQFTGKVVCVDCTLNEVRHAQPTLPNLYVLKHVGNENQRAVVTISTISEPMRWDAVVFPHEVLVRTTDKLFHELTAEKNLYKTVQVTGLLRSDRIMDVQGVTYPE